MQGSRRLIGRWTHQRRWIDFEIRTALHVKPADSPRPLVGILTPDLSALAEKLRSPIDAMRWRAPLTAEASRIVKARATELNAVLKKDFGVGLPIRLLDNLLVGYGVF